MRTQQGFTLLEVLLAVAITAVVMVAVSGTFISTMRAHYEVDNLNSSAESGQRVLTLIERDLQSLWHHNVKGNKVFVGRNLDVGGFDADRMDFYSSSDAITGVFDNQNQLAFPSVCEVGYWLKRNERIPGLLELWRREDPMIDDDILQEGQFQLVSDRIKSFNITYYETLGYDAEPVDEWDSSREGKLPRRLKLEFTIHRKIGNRNEISGSEVDDFEKILKTYTRHIVLDPRLTNILQAGVAMVPIAPPPPEAESEGGGGGGGGGGIGGGMGGGPGGPGGGGPDGGPGGPGPIDVNGGGFQVGPGGRGQGGGGRGGGNRGAPPPTPIPGGGFNLGDLLGGGRGGGGGLFGGGGGGGR